MANFIKSVIAVFFSASSLFASAQKIATLEVVLNKETAGFDIPVSIGLDNITYLPDSLLTLVELQNGKRVAVPRQVENYGSRTLHWIVKNTSANKKRIFELEQGSQVTVTGRINATAKDGFLNISNGNKDLLRYNYKVIYPKKGTDTVFKRSGFIHPLFTPHGQELTRIEAWDHPHHFGLWNPWTHVLFEGDTVDFWNLIKKQGTVRFAGFASVNYGPVFAGYKTLHRHIQFLKDGTENGVLNEVQSVRIYQSDSNSDYYLMDITIHLNAATQSPVTLLKYTYGSLGWRATAKWNKNNSEVLTSEGKTRKDADGSRARWVLVQGNLDDDYGGAVMMSYPVNYNHPEPLRVWPENIFNNGDMYTNFVPVKDRDWVIEPGRDYVLKYRFVVFNGKFDRAKAEAAWQYFAHAPVINIKLAK